MTQQYFGNRENNLLSSRHAGLFAFADRQIDNLRALGRWRTAECYAVSVDRFKAFRKGRNVRIDSMDADMMERFEAYLRRRGLCRNTTSFYLRNIRSIYNKAAREGLAPRKPIFDSVYTGVDKTVKRAVGLKEIKKIKRINLSDNAPLDLARDLFLFSFYTRGMAFVDIALLRKRDVADGYLTYTRKKTGQQLTIKWRNEMQTIVDKYDTHATQYLLPVIETEDGTERRQYLNKMLLVNRKLKLLAKQTGITSPLTMYVARHSWASIARQKNIPTSVISKGMGHDSETTTEIYLSSIETGKVDDANDRILRSL